MVCFSRSSRYSLSKMPYRKVYLQDQNWETFASSSPLLFSSSSLPLLSCRIVAVHHLPHLVVPSQTPLLVDIFSEHQRFLNVRNFEGRWKKNMVSTISNQWSVLEQGVFIFHFIIKDVFQFLLLNHQLLGPCYHQRNQQVLITSMRNTTWNMFSVVKIAKVFN